MCGECDDKGAVVLATGRCCVQARLIVSGLSINGRRKSENISRRFYECAAVKRQIAAGLIVVPITDH